MGFCQGPSDRLRRALERAAEADRKDAKGREVIRLIKEGTEALKKKHKEDMQNMIDEAYEKVYGTKDYGKKPQQ